MTLRFYKNQLRNRAPYVIHLVRLIRLWIRLPFRTSKSLIFYAPAGRPVSSEQVTSLFELKELRSFEEFFRYSETDPFWTFSDHDTLQRRFLAKQHCMAYVQNNSLIALGWLVKERESVFTPRFPNWVTMAQTLYFCGAMIHRDFIVKRGVMVEFYRSIVEAALNMGYSHVIGCVFPYNKYGLQVIRRAGFVECGHYRWIRIGGLQREFFKFTIQIRGLNG